MTGGPAAGERGIALLVVLAVLGGISLSAILVSTNSRRIVSEAGFARQDLTIRQAELAALDMFGDRLSNQSANLSFEFNLDGIRVAVRARPESAKLDLNLASEATLARFFAYFLNDPDLGVRLASSIADWRDPDDLTRLNGAEANAYREAGLRVLPSNAPFESVEQLQGVLGMIPSLFGCTRPYLSVQSGTEVPDTRAASPLLLRALGLVPESSPPGSASIVGPLGTRSGDVFEVSIDVDLGEGSVESRSGYVVRALGDQRTPLAILDRQPADEWSRESRSACAALGIAQGETP
jgi:type II secretory pathway component PulK